ncbi:UNVERIFIED_CONTAM: hypothetical protein HHA_453760 [Hammondia hammondi]|eukprot:XP_008887090.1 hypothetical protein HHA_453760 [Hammondia hammondi]
MSGPSSGERRTLSEAEKPNTHLVTVRQRRETENDTETRQVGPEKGDAQPHLTGADAVLGDDLRTRKVDQLSVEAMPLCSLVPPMRLTETDEETETHTSSDASDDLDLLTETVCFESPDAPKGSRERSTTHVSVYALGLQSLPWTVFLLRKRLRRFLSAVQRSGLLGIVYAPALCRTHSHSASHLDFNFAAFLHDEKHKLRRPWDIYFAAEHAGSGEAARETEAKRKEDSETGKRRDDGEQKIAGEREQSVESMETAGKKLARKAERRRAIERHEGERDRILEAVNELRHVVWGPRGLLTSARHAVVDLSEQVENIARSLCEEAREDKKEKTKEEGNGDQTKKEDKKKEEKERDETKREEKEGETEDEPEREEEDKLKAPMRERGEIEKDKEQADLCEPLNQAEQQKEEYLKRREKKIRRRRGRRRAQEREANRRNNHSPVGGKEEQVEDDLKQASAAQEQSSRILGGLRQRETEPDLVSVQHEEEKMARGGSEEVCDRERNVDSQQNEDWQRQELLRHAMLDSLERVLLRRFGSMCDKRDILILPFFSRRRAEAERFPRCSSSSSFPSLPSSSSNSSLACSTASSSSSSCPSSSCVSRSLRSPFSSRRMSAPPKLFLVGSTAGEAERLFVETVLAVRTFLSAGGGTPRKPVRRTRIISPIPPFSFKTSRDAESEQTPSRALKQLPAVPLRSSSSSSSLPHPASAFLCSQLTDPVSLASFAEYTFDVFISWDSFSPVSRLSPRASSSPGEASETAEKEVLLAALGWVEEDVENALELIAAACDSRGKDSASPLWLPLHWHAGKAEEEPRKQTENEEGVTEGTKQENREEWSILADGQEAPRPLTFVQRLGTTVFQVPRALLPLVFRASLTALREFFDDPRLGIQATCADILRAFGGTLLELDFSYSTHSWLSPVSFQCAPCFVSPVLESLGVFFLLLSSQFDFCSLPVSLDVSLVLVAERRVAWRRLLRDERRPKRCQTRGKKTTDRRGVSEKEPREKSEDDGEVERPMKMAESARLCKQKGGTSEQRRDKVSRGDRARENRLEKPEEEGPEQSRLTASAFPSHEEPLRSVSSSLFATHRLIFESEPLYPPCQLAAVQQALALVRGPFYSVKGGTVASPVTTQFSHPGDIGRVEAEREEEQGRRRERIREEREEEREEERSEEKEENREATGGEEREQWREEKREEEQHGNGERMTEEREEERRQGREDEREEVGDRERTDGGDGESDQWREEKRETVGGGRDEDEKGEDDGTVIEERGASRRAAGLSAGTPGGGHSKKRETAWRRKTDGEAKRERRPPRREMTVVMYNPNDIPTDLLLLITREGTLEAPDRIYDAIISEASYIAATEPDVFLLSGIPFGFAPLPHYSPYALSPSSCSSSSSLASDSSSSSTSFFSPLSPLRSSLSSSSSSLSASSSTSASQFPAVPPWHATETHDAERGEDVALKDALARRSIARTRERRCDASRDFSVSLFRQASFVWSPCASSLFLGLLRSSSPSAFVSSRLDGQGPCFMTVNPFYVDGRVFTSADKKEVPRSEFLVPFDLGGRFIGPGGKHRKHLIARTRGFLSVSNERHRGPDGRSWRRLVVGGDFDARLALAKEIFRLLQWPASSAQAPGRSSNVKAHAKNPKKALLDLFSLQALPRDRLLGREEKRETHSEENEKKANSPASVSCIQKIPLETGVARLLRDLSRRLVDFSFRLVVTLKGEERNGSFCIDRELLRLHLERQQLSLVRFEAFSLVNAPTDAAEGKTLQRCATGPEVRAANRDKVVEEVQDLGDELWTTLGDRDEGTDADQSVWTSGDREERRETDADCSDSSCTLGDACGPASACPPAHMQSKKKSFSVTLRGTREALNARSAAAFAFLLEDTRRVETVHFSDGVQWFFFLPDVEKGRVPGTSRSERASALSPHSCSFCGLAWVRVHEGEAAVESAWQGFLSGLDWSGRGGALLRLAGGDFLFHVATCTAFPIIRRRRSSDCRREQRREGSCSDAGRETEETGKRDVEEHHGEKKEESKVKDGPVQNNVSEAPAEDGDDLRQLREAKASQVSTRLSVDQKCSSSVQNTTRGAMRKRAKKTFPSLSPEPQCLLSSSSLLASTTPAHASPFPGRQTGQARTQRKEKSEKGKAPTENTGDAFLRREAEGGDSLGEDEESGCETAQQVTQREVETGAENGNEETARQNGRISPGRVNDAMPVNKDEITFAPSNSCLLPLDPQCSVPPPESVPSVSSHSCILHLSSARRVPSVVTAPEAAQDSALLAAALAASLENAERRHPSWSFALDFSRPPVRLARVQIGECGGEKRSGPRENGNGAVESTEQEEVRGGGEQEEKRGEGSNEEERRSARDRGRAPPNNRVEARERRAVGGPSESEGRPRHAGRRMVTEEEFCSTGQSGEDDRRTTGCEEVENEGSVSAEKETFLVCRDILRRRTRALLQNFL